MDNNRKRLTYVMIVCPGHSGSTLLAMCLNCHSKITFFGEFESIGRRLNRLEDKRSDAICSFCGPGCGFIDQKEKALLQFCYMSRNRLLRRAKVLFTHALYVRHLSGKTNSRVIGDSSKRTEWATKIYRFYRSFFDIKFIFLFRNGYGVISSHVRQGRELESVAREWKKEVRKILSFREGLDKDRYINVKYEEFVLNPAKTLKDICAFTGVRFEEQMLKYESHPHHIIGGNAGARVRAKIKQEQIIKHGRKDIDWYLNKKTPFFLDERWKEEMSRGQILKARDIIEQEQALLRYD